MKRFINLIISNIRELRQKRRFTLHNLKDKFTYRNLAFTMVSLVFAYLLRPYLISLLDLDLKAFADFLLFGLVYSGIKALFKDLFEIIFPTIYCMDNDTEESLADADRERKDKRNEQNRASKNRRIQALIDDSADPTDEEQAAADAAFDPNQPGTWSTEHTRESLKGKDAEEVKKFFEEQGKVYKKSEKDNINELKQALKEGTMTEDEYSQYVDQQVEYTADQLKQLSIIKRDVVKYVDPNKD